MTLDDVRKLCLSLPHATERVQWGDNLVFKVAGKMFCVLNLEPGRDEVVLSFKVTDEEFPELLERDGVVPAPYMARAKWVSLEHYGALPAAELRRLIRQSYDLVRAKLPKKVEAKLRGPARHLKSHI